MAGDQSALKGMQVRKFRIGDEVALFAVFYSAVHQIACKDYSQAQIDAWAPTNVDWPAWEARIRGIDPFVVELAEQPIAYADLQANGYIDHFFVSGDHPRQGAGRLLMETLLDEAHRRRLDTLTADVSLTAQPFFAHFGFDIVERRTPILRGVSVPNALMRRAPVPR